MIQFITEYIEAGNNRTLDEYLNHGGFVAFRRALSLQPQDVIEEMKNSGLRGRGGAYFPVGIKWQSFKDAGQQERYLICNGDEGEPGTFKDRYLLEKCCWQVFEGMMIAAYATGTSKAYFYLRSEYRYLHLEKALKVLRQNGLLGKGILGTRFDFDIELRSGAGAYICGEESALIESLEGKRGLTRTKPPIPTASGLWGCPTLINNVETFACVVQIVKYGSRAFRELGKDTPSGTKLVCLSGAFKRKGVFEVPFGISLKEIVDQVGGGSAKEEKIKFLHLGGLTGSCLSADHLDGLSYDIDALKAQGLSVGTGAIYAGSHTVDYLQYIRAAFDFFQGESCGRCTPCREGIRQIVLELDRLAHSDRKGETAEKCLYRIERVGETMRRCSACGLGKGIPVFLQSALRLYKECEG